MSGAGLIEMLAARLGGRGMRRSAPALREVLASAMTNRAPVTAYEPIASRIDDPMAEGAMLAGADDMAPPMPNAARTGPDGGPVQAGQFRPYPRFPETDLATDQFFPVVPRPDGYEAIGERLLGSRQFVEREIPLDDLVATQSSVSRNFADRPSGDLPDVVQINGVNHIWDGTNRLAAARARGESTVRVRFYTADSTGPDAGPSQTGFRLPTDIRRPSEDINEVLDANFEYGQIVGNETAPINSLIGGVSSAENGRVGALARQISGPDGYVERIIVDDVGNVIEGQHRLDALRQLGATEVPIVRVRDNMRNFDFAEVSDAMQSAGQMHSDQVHGLVRELSSALARENGSVAAVRANWEPPRGFAAQWEAGLNAVERRAPNPPRTAPDGGATRTEINPVIPPPPEGARRLYNASTIDRDPNGYLDPHVSGWVEEVANGAGDFDDISQITRPLVYMSDSPESWVRMIVGRKIGRHPTEVTMEDIRANGRLNIVDADPEYDNIFQVGDYSRDGSVTTLAGERKRMWETNLYDSDEFSEMPVGPEPNDFIARESVSVSHSLTGDDLVRFLEQNSNRNAPNAGASGAGQQGWLERIRSRSAEEAKAIYAEMEADASIPTKELQRLAHEYTGERMTDVRTRPAALAAIRERIWREAWDDHSLAVLRQRGADRRAPTNAGSDRNALQRALRERMDRE